MGAIAEAMVSRLVLEAIRKEGYRVTRFARNYRVDEEDIDLLVWAEKEGERKPCSLSRSRLDLSMVMLEAYWPKQS